MYLNNIYHEFTTSEGTPIVTFSANTPQGEAQVFIEKAFVEAYAAQRVETAGQSLEQLLPTLDSIDPDTRMPDAFLDWVYAEARRSGKAYGAIYRTCERDNAVGHYNPFYVSYSPYFSEAVRLFRQYEEWMDLLQSAYWHAQHDIFDEEYHGNEVWQNEKFDQLCPGVSFDDACDYLDVAARYFKEHKNPSVAENEVWDNAIDAWLKAVREANGISNDYVFIDMGCLLTSEDEDFEAYNNVYDRQYGYADFDQYYARNLQKQIEQARKDIMGMDDMCYIIIQPATLDEDEIEKVGLENIEIDGETYFASDVEFSIAKINSEIVENFVKTGRDADGKLIAK